MEFPAQEIVPLLVEMVGEALVVLLRSLGAQKVGEELHLAVASCHLKRLLRALGENEELHRWGVVVQFFEKPKSRSF